MKADAKLTPQGGWNFRPCKLPSPERSDGTPCPSVHVWVALSDGSCQIAYCVFALGSDPKVATQACDWFTMRGIRIADSDVIAWKPIEPPGHPNRSLAGLADGSRPVAGHGGHLPAHFEHPAMSALASLTARRAAMGYAEAYAQRALDEERARRQPEPDREAPPPAAPNLDDAIATWVRKNMSIVATPTGWRGIQVTEFSIALAINGDSRPVCVTTMIIKQ